MKERPKDFNAEEIRAILEGRKTQFRWVIRPQPTQISCIGLPTRDDNTFNYPNRRKVIPCRYGKPGDIIWARETWRVGAWDVGETQIAIDYKADGYCQKEYIVVPEEFDGRRHEEDFMFNRLWMESSDDAEEAGHKIDCEGNYNWEPGQSPCRWRSPILMPRWASRITREITNIRGEWLQEITEADVLAEGCTNLDYEDPCFVSLWDSLNAKKGYPWESNPLVEVAEFKVI